MSCQLKNTIGPSQIQCSFPEVADGKGDFSVYFNPFNGPAAQLMVTCTHNGRYACIPDEVVVTHENLNTATITVTETFANKNGTFSCQRGDIPVTNKCQFPFFENVHPTSSFNSEVDHAMTPHGVSTLKPEQFEDGGVHKIISVEIDDITATIIGVAVGVVLLILILVIGLLLWRRYKTKKRRERSNNSETYEGAPSIKFLNEDKNTKKRLPLKDQLKMLISCSTPEETNAKISCDEQGSIFKKPQKNGGIGVQSDECNMNDSGLKKLSGSSPSGSEGSNTPLISSTEGENPPV